MRPVTDRAEVAIDFPEKAYIWAASGTRPRLRRAAADCVEFKLAHAGGAKRSVELHLRRCLFADMLDKVVASLEGRAGPLDETHRAARPAISEPDRREKHHG